MYGSGLDSHIGTFSGDICEGEREGRVCVREEGEERVCVCEGGGGRACVQGEEGVCVTVCLKPTQHLCATLLLKQTPSLQQIRQSQQISHRTSFVLC